ncbi:MAG TPA: class IV adenylate cyclase [Candidatus Acidoferrales bacterium]|nr:class IV adenylate cyclase [Candidatus Acidoferrales bacterium]
MARSRRLALYSHAFNFDAVTIDTRGELTFALNSDYTLRDMPKNIEIKAALNNVGAARNTAIRLSGGNPDVLHQEDVFFRCEAARLKLRIFGPHSGELIRYQRSNVPAARVSQYLIARTHDPEILRNILTETLGVIGVVKKTRELFLIGQTRIHIDDVDGLGDFLELEVVMRPGQKESEGQEIVRDLLSEFCIGQDQLLGDAYIDVLRRRQGLAI